MEAKKYKYRSASDFEIEAAIPLKYERCNDGYAVYSGTLPASGLNPCMGRGITLPEDIDGIPVTELSGTYNSSEIEFVDAASIKRIAVTVTAPHSLFDNSQKLLCRPPQIFPYGRALESIDLTFTAEKMTVGNFSGFTSLRSVTFTGKATGQEDWEGSIFERDMFKNCINLLSVRGRLEGDFLCGSSFEGCSSLLSLPDIDVKYMDDREFYGCSSLTRIHLHNGLKRIGSSAFQGCSSLKDIYIPDTVTELGYAIFKDCPSLETIHLPDTLDKISFSMFSGCHKLQKVFLPDKITSIENEAFLNCKSMRSPWIPNGLKKIGERAFFGCSGIFSIMIPDSVEEIGRDAFSECPGLIIKCHEGSVGHKYATENNIRFELL